MEKYLTILGKSQKASYKVAYLIAKDKKKKPHTIGETQIKPAAIAISQIMNGDKVTKEMKESPMSADTIRRPISGMGQNIKCQLIDRVNRGKYALQLDETTDTSGLAQLSVFVKYIANGKLEEALSGTCTGKDIFSAVETSTSICTDGAGVMAGKHKGFLARLLQIAPHIDFRHYILHRENLASKTLDQQLKCVLDSAVNIVNYIKSRPPSD
ncbi:protein FAM200C-like [Styela clava]